jgi:uncharacterized protein YkwD
LRKVGATVLAVPVIVAFYVASLRGRGGAHRLLAALGAAVVVAIVAIASLPPAQSAAVPASVPTPVTAQLLDAVRTGHPVTAPIQVEFDSPMDAASVAGALRVSPDSAIKVTWDAAGRQLTIAPMAHWQPDTLYTVTIDASARSEQGGRLDSPVRAVVLTTRAGTATIAASTSVKGHARTDTKITIHLDRPVPMAALRAALRTQPAIEGTLQAGATAADYTFTPSAALHPASKYQVSLTGLVDADGVPFATTPAITVSTVNAPTVVRFRPFDKSQKVDRASLLSVRFTESMDHASTARAFTVTAGGKRVAGTTGWAEKSHVLVFRPSVPLAYGATVVMSVGPAATSRAGVPVQAASATFRVVPKPAPPAAKPKATHTGGSGSVRRQPITHSGGSGAVAGSWHAVEAYYLRLMNCTRTGGWVTSGGSCSSPGGRNVKPLVLSDNISSRVSRPYAKRLATNNQCDHFIGGTPGDRLRRAGYSSYRWGENLGCRSGNPYSAVLGSHLFFQSEKPYNGGHYKNLMNAQYDRVGIGVWVSHGRVRLVIDFYHP